MDDRQRCREAGVPESVLFETKPELAERSEHSPVTSAYSEHASEAEALVSSLTLTSSRNEDDAGGKCFLIICDREVRRLSI